MINTSKYLLPLVVITASLGGCMLLFETEARPETPLHGTSSVGDQDGELTRGE